MKTIRLFFQTLTFISLIVFFSSCDKSKIEPNLFTIQQEIDLGKKFDEEIDSNKTDYPILDKTKYPLAYQHLERIRDAILTSDDFKHKKDFDWQVKIIHNDSVLNAFCAPAGYMYFYTGIIKYLENEAHFAGVMAHEMAHADKRHVTERLSAIYGAQYVLDLLLGEDPGKLESIVRDLALGLGALQFSRTNEYEADEFAVRYTADTEIHARGIAGFFEKLETENHTSKTFEFLSTHPSPKNRIQHIDSIYSKVLGSPEGGMFEDRYQEFKNSLP